MAAKTPHVCESAVISSLRRFRDRYFPNKVQRDGVTPVGEDEEPCQLGYLESLPVDVQFLVMAFLSPADICRLGATSRYWRAMVRDPLLWRYFLFRDMPYWTSIDHLTMPQMDAPLINEDESVDDREEGSDKGMEVKFDYMSEYLKGCPSCRQQWLPSRPAYEVVTSFLQSLVPSPEPRYAMFGPGMEELDVSIVTRLMHTPDVLPISGIPNRQINGGSFMPQSLLFPPSKPTRLHFCVVGIGSGISYIFNNQHKFNILTLYSTFRAEREQARVQHQSIGSKLFIFEASDEAGCPVYTPAPQVQQVCQVVDGFIYVANAEPGRVGDCASEAAHIRAVLSSGRGTSARPLLVLSCISKEEPQTARTANPQNVTRDQARRRTPCVDMAKRLELPKVANPWMVQDVVAESLAGVLDGIFWLLKCSGVKL